MTNEERENHIYKFENCRAKTRGTTNLVDCLSQHQAGICKVSLAFGGGYFCKHPERDKIIRVTQNLEDELRVQSNVSKSERQ